MFEGTLSVLVPVFGIFAFMPPLAVGSEVNVACTVTVVAGMVNVAAGSSHEPPDIGR